MGLFQRICEFFENENRDENDKGIEYQKYIKSKMKEYRYYGGHCYFNDDNKFFNKFVEIFDNIYNGYRNDDNKADAFYELFNSIDLNDTNRVEFISEYCFIYRSQDNEEFVQIVPFKKSMYGPDDYHYVTVYHPDNDKIKDLYNEEHGVIRMYFHIKDDLCKKIADFHKRMKESKSYQIWQNKVQSARVAKQREEEEQRQQCKDKINTLIKDI